MHAQQRAERVEIVTGCTVGRIDDPGDRSPGAARHLRPASQGIRAYQRQAFVLETAGSRNRRSTRDELRARRPSELVVGKIPLRRKGIAVPVRQEAANRESLRVEIDAGDGVPPECFQGTQAVAAVTLIHKQIGGGVDRAAAGAIFLAQRVADAVVTGAFARIATPGGRSPVRLRLAHEPSEGIIIPARCQAVGVHEGSQQPGRCVPVVANRVTERIDDALRMASVLVPVNRDRARRHAGTSYGLARQVAVRVIDECVGDFPCGVPRLEADARRAALRAVPVLVGIPHDGRPARQRVTAGDLYRLWPTETPGGDVVERRLLDPERGGSTGMVAARNLRDRCRRVGDET